MNKKLFAGALIMLGLVLSGCTAQAETPNATEAPVDPATEVVVVSAPDSSECLACHTDKQQLIDTAAPVAEAEAESKGVG